MTDEDRYVVYSHEHQMWWKADHRGYTPDLHLAGRYTAEEAGEITINVIPPGTEVAMHETIAARHGARLCWGYQTPRYAVRS